MRLSEFDYEYPEELIAQHPLPERDASRMMVVNRATGSFEHSAVSNITSYLREGDVVVLNDSRVVAARIFGRRGNGEDVEVLVVEPHDAGKNLWRCLLKKAKRVRAGENIFFGMQSKATALGREGTFLILEFLGNSLDLAIKHHGVPPLPPYIEREGYRSYSEEDRERYQTVYAKKAGSAAAPTAGLHLSNGLIGKIGAAGVEIEHVTLHVGIDTFTPMRKDDITDHKMHGEMVEISAATAEKLSTAKKRGRRIIAVGTTTTRALESALTDEGFKNGSFKTDLFIKPGYEFRTVNAMLTNFHQPKSTLLVLVSAFAGRDLILKCYAAAINERYRLFSFGDCMLIV